LVPALVNGRETPEMEVKYIDHGLKKSRWAVAKELS